MYKIAILGCENSHADSFLGFINNDKKFSDVEVIGIYSNDKEAAKKLSERFNVKVLENFADAKDEADGVMVTARHGNHHLEYVKPYLEKGIPVFMDKPITISKDDAKEMAMLFKRYGNKFTGGSSLKLAPMVKEMKERHEKSRDTDAKTIGGVVRAPLDPKNLYGDFYFYSQHLVEIICEVFGSYPKSIKAFEKNNHVSVVFRFNDFDVFGFYGASSSHYNITRFSLNDTESEKVVLTEDVFREEFSGFYRLLKKEEVEQDMKRFMAPVYILNAIEKSFKNGTEEYIDWEEV